MADAEYFVYVEYENDDGLRTETRWFARDDLMGFHFADRVLDRAVDSKVHLRTMVVGMAQDYERLTPQRCRSNTSTMMMHNAIAVELMQLHELVHDASVSQVLQQNEGGDVDAPLDVGN